MPASPSLPDGYRLTRTIDLSKQPGLLLWLNLIGLGLLFIFAWLFFYLAMRLRTSTNASLASSNPPPAGWLTFLAIVLALAGVLLLHEVVHGIFFWLITRRRPRFGLQITYAYAAAPDFFIPRNPYLVIGLSPLVLITLVGVALLPVLPSVMVLPCALALALNASGSVGDVYIVGGLLGRPADTLVNDHGDCIHIFVSQTA